MGGGGREVWKVCCIHLVKKKRIELFLSKKIVNVKKVWLFCWEKRIFFFTRPNQFTFFTPHPSGSNTIFFQKRWNVLRSMKKRKVNHKRGGEGNFSSNTAHEIYRSWVKSFTFCSNKIVEALKEDLHKETKNPIKIDFVKVSNPMKKWKKNIKMKSVFLSIKKLKLLLFLWEYLLRIEKN